GLVMDQRSHAGVANPPALPAQSGAGASEIAAPRWLQQVDLATIVLINLALVAEVTIVFLNTVLRNGFNATLMPGVEETSRLFLIITAFLGGAVAYGRGRFM